MGEKTAENILLLAEELTFTLSFLDSQGRSDTDEADAAREKLYEVWLSSPSLEQAYLQRLSAEFNVLTDDESPTPSAASKARGLGLPHGQHHDGKILRKAISAAIASKRFDRALQLMRLNPSCLAKEQRCSLRCYCYVHLRRFVPARRFAEIGRAVDPKDPSLLCGLIISFGELGLVQEFDELLENEALIAQLPGLSITAGSVAWKLSRHAEVNDQLRYRVKRAIALIDGVLSSNSVPPPMRGSRAIAAAFVTKALLLAKIGASDDAASALDQAVAESPDDGAIRVIRGQKRLESDQEVEALEDFAVAVELGAHYYMPYLILARRFFSLQLYNECLNILGRARQCVTEPLPARVEATMLHFRAICQFELKVDWKSSRKLMSRAQNLSPDDEVIQENAHLLDRRLAAREHAERWVEPSQPSSLKAHRSRFSDTDFVQEAVLDTSARSSFEMVASL